MVFLRHKFLGNQYYLTLFYDYTFLLNLSSALFQNTQVGKLLSYLQNEKSYYVTIFIFQFRLLLLEFKLCLPLFLLMLLDHIIFFIQFFSFIFYLKNIFFQTCYLFLGLRYVFIHLFFVKVYKLHRHLTEFRSLLVNVWF